MLEYKLTDSEMDEVLNAMRGKGFFAPPAGLATLYDVLCRHDGGKPWAERSEVNPQAFAIPESQTMVLIEAMRAESDRTMLFWLNKGPASYKEKVAT